MKKLLPKYVRTWLRDSQRGIHYPLRGMVRFGSLRRLTPISSNWGIERGTCVDRYYIEKFLTRYAPDVSGNVLEIQENDYTLRFGGARITRSDVLHVEEGYPKATIIADLTKADHIPSDSFDCIILTQTLQLIYDVRAAISTLYRILKPGGVLLATFPGISHTYDLEWSKAWCWNFTTRSARLLFEEAFPPENLRVQAYGNVLVTISFLHGLSAEELRQKELDYYDPGYEMLITLRAVKPEDK